MLVEIRQGCIISLVARAVPMPSRSKQGFPVRARRRRPPPPSDHTARFWCARKAQFWSEKGSVLELERQCFGARKAVFWS